MDPQLKSVLTTILLGLMTSLAGAGASHGIIPASDVTSYANMGVTLALGAGAALIGWYKARQSSPAALIDAVNKGDNGVKVVPATAPVSPVNVPLK